MANHENQPGPDADYVPWNDQELIDRSKGNLDYFIVLADEARARSDFEQAAQRGVSDKEYIRLRDNLQFFKNELSKYEIEHGYASTPEDDPS